MRVETGLVKYEFTTTDEQGNKTADPMSKEEALQAMQEISGQYGGNVMVEFSGKGLEALSQSIREQAENGSWKLTEEQRTQRVQKQELLDQSIVHLENTHRLIIPNIQTNEKLYGSLEDAPEHIVKAANGIIKNCLMPHDVSGMTEEQRRDQIAFGLEEARYLAENYLDEKHAGDFLSAMETIAKYGMNGTVSGDGKVAYHVEKGPLVGASEDYVSQNDILKEKAPELYNELYEVTQSAARGETGWGQKFIELQKRVNQFLNSPSGTGGLTNYEKEVADYREWKKKTDATELPAAFNKVDYTDTIRFFDSLKAQSSLTESWLAKAQERFTRWLETE